MTEADLKQHIEDLIREMIEDGATWADERWGILGDLFEDLWGYCYCSFYCHTQQGIAVGSMRELRAESSALFKDFKEYGWERLSWWWRYRPSSVIASSFVQPVD